MPWKRLTTLEYPQISAAFGPCRWNMGELTLVYDWPYIHELPPQSGSLDFKGGGADRRQPEVRRDSVGWKI